MLLSVVTMLKYDPTLFDGVDFPPGIDKDTAINAILLQNAELELIYSSLEPLRVALEVWSKSRAWTWLRYAKILASDYDPIENYNRMEESSTQLTASNNSRTKSAVYNQAEMVDTAAGESSGSNNGTTSSHIHGNIGVTTTQKMLEEEVSITEKVDIYGFIAADFRRRFCVLVY